MASISLERFLKGTVLKTIYRIAKALHCRPLRSKEEECQFIYGEVSDDIETQSHVEVTLDWAPPGIASSLASKYLKTLPQGHIPIQGSEGAIRRRKQLEKQFPLHDVEPEICHQLTTGEINL